MVRIFHMFALLQNPIHHFFSQIATSDGRHDAAAAFLGLLFAS